VGDVYDSVMDLSDTAGKNGSFQAKVGDINFVLTWCMVGECETETVRRIEKIFYATVRARDQAIGLIYLDRGRALGACILYSETHSRCPFLVPGFWVFVNPQPVQTGA
jgi:hypothetical protein